jgi:hypothetical protein
MLTTGTVRPLSRFDFTTSRRGADGTDPKGRHRHPYIRRDGNRSGHLSGYKPLRKSARSVGKADSASSRSPVNGCVNASSEACRNWRLSPGSGTP